MARISTTMAILHATDLTIHRVVVLPLKGSKDPQPDATDMVEELCFSSKFSEGAVDGDMVLDIHHDNAKEMLTILLGDTLIRGDSYRIGVLYTGEIDTNGGEKGFFRLKYPSNQYDEEKNNCCPRCDYYCLFSEYRNVNEFVFSCRLIGATQLEAIYGELNFIFMGRLSSHKEYDDVPIRIYN